VDFAYAVHTDIGNSCVGCKINGRHMPLVTELKSGDEVEIIRSEARTPPPAWEGIAVTGKARSAIRRATREAVRRQYCKLGREMLQRAFRRVDRKYRKATVERALNRLSQNTVDEVLAAVGRGELASADVVKAAFPKLSPPEPPRRRSVTRSSDDGWFGIRKAMGLKFRWPGSEPKDKGEAANGIPIRGQKDDLPVRFAAKGGAVPGDRIVGILTPGQGITIYPIHAEELKEYDDQPERWIDVTWDIDENSADRFPAQIAVTTVNEPGSLAQIAQVISDGDGNIDNIKMTRHVTDYTEMLIDVEVWDLKHLNEIISGLRGKSVVSAVSRVQG
jgi:(p)ppGpp synthase/HD superfamily hydrolase